MKPNKRLVSGGAEATNRSVSVRLIGALLIWAAGSIPPADSQTVTQTAPQTSTTQTAPSVKSPWASDILYFVILDRFADGETSTNKNVDIKAKGTFHGGDLNGLRARLNEIAGLGVTALWITPVVKNIDDFVTGAGFPDWGYHGYWADDFTKMDPRFGTEEDLKALVVDCHKKGIKVLLDVVYNHAGYNSSYITDPKTKSWLRVESLGTCGTDDITQCVAGLPDFKTEIPEVAEYLLNANLSLAQRTGVDGFRLDTVKHIDHSFWKEHRARTQELLGKDFFLLGEVWGGDPQVLDPYFAGDEMDAGFDFSFQGNVISFVSGRGRTIAFDRYLKSREKVRSGYIMCDFLSSHDVPGALFQLQEDKILFRLAMILQFTSIGIPMIYYGEEVGRVGGDWPDNRSDMPWGDSTIMPGKGQPRDEKLRADYIKMISIRRAHPALWQGIHTGLSTEGDLLVFQMRDPQSGDVVIVAVNRGSAPVQAAFKSPSDWSQTPVKDAWNGNEIIPVKDGQIDSSIPARSARIFVSDARRGARRVPFPAMKNSGSGRTPSAPTARMDSLSICDSSSPAYASHPPEATGTNLERRYDDGEC